VTEPNPIHSAAFRRALRFATERVLGKGSVSRLLQAADAALAGSGGAMQGLKDDAAALIRMVREAAAGRYRRVPKRAVIAAVAALVYFLDPLDLIPDFIPVLGLADDAAVLAWVLHQIRRDLVAYREWEKEWGGAIDVELGEPPRDDEPAPVGPPRLPAGPAATGDQV
jgi:uncharacterized membrane protein YkvA (DUF1232 family)